MHRIAVGVLLAAQMAGADDLSRQAYNILKKNCFDCHGETRTSGLDLRSEGSVAAGGSRGPAVVSGRPARSLLYQVISQAAKPAMPPGGKLAAAEIEIVKQWIAAGGSFDGVAEAVTPDEQKRKAELAKLEERPITPAERRFWAFQKPQPVTVPALASHPVDAFLLAAMKAKGLKPSPPADRRTLIRRVYLDVLGLPPRPEEVETFVNDREPGAWERLVDRVLASPHYGERWARHWLDLVRYADSGGFEFDVDRPDGWRYRDYVVNSLNNDKPYDRFVREQIAGDEIDPTSQEAMIATGYLRLGPEGGGGGERGLQDSLDDILSTTGLTFLGQTIGCARCHNHKFDPIPQKDYYRMQAVFYPLKPLSHPLVTAEAVAAHKAELARIDGLQKPLKKAKEELEAPYKKRLFDETIAGLPEYMQAAWKTPAAQRTEGQQLTVLQIEKTLLDDQLRGRIADKHLVPLMTGDERRRHQELVEQIAALDKERPKPLPTARAVEEGGREAKPSYFLHRGSVDTKGTVMQPGALSVIGEPAFSQPPENAKSSWRRRGLAEWIASPENPLTARVMVNRIWQLHFGEGIVRTPSNFGTTGDAPTHPALLDWLALEFVKQGWSMKAMHRLMMTSQAYQAESHDIAANMAIDPENKLFWRMPRQRLDAEAIRDRILAVSGALDRTAGGPCVYPYINPDLFQSSTKRTWPGKPDSDPSTWRRSLYVYSKRSIRYPMFETFDQPNLVNSCDRRNRSTIAPQALLLMNNSFVLEQARLFAERLRKEARADEASQIDRAWRLALGRAPDAEERARAGKYLRENPDGLAGLAQALFNLNEFVYRQ